MSLHSGFKRLHRRKDIIRVYAEGRRVRGRSFDLIVLRRERKSLRIAVVVPLLGKTAVERNRVKRRAKEALRRRAFEETAVGDVVIRAKGEAYDRDYTEIREELDTLFSSLDGR